MFRLHFRNWIARLFRAWRRDRRDWRERDRDAEAGASFPHQVAVTEIEAYPPEHELPDWDDIRGRAPDATGDLSSEAFVRELRDGWR